MNDDFFADMARQMRPSDQVRAELEHTLAAEESPSVPAAGASRRSDRLRSIRPVE